jgi:hypothetical protein
VAALSEEGDLGTRRVFGVGPARSTVAFYQRVLGALSEGGVPFLVGGGFAFSHYTGIARYTKDLDIFVRPGDARWTLDTIAQTGYRSEMIAPHWLGKVYAEESFVDIIFSSGNGVAVVDDEWFEHAEDATVLDRQVLLSPVEEMIWSKAFVLERERYDGADVAHLIRARGKELDWERLFRRFDPHWHLLFSHLLLFRFAYPSERAVVPRWVLRGLLGRLEWELGAEVPGRRVCQGTLLSARQYLPDVEAWGYEDARLDPDVQMTKADIAQLTDEIKAEAARGNSVPRGDDSGDAQVGRHR